MICLKISSLKTNTPPISPTPRHWKVKPPSRKWFLEKNKQSWKLSLILVFHSQNKTGKAMAEIQQKRDFLAWSIQNFVRKKKQFVRKYYITWLIDLVNKLIDVEKFFDFIFCFFKKFCKKTCWIKFNSLYIKIWLSSLNIFDENQLIMR